MTDATPNPSGAAATTAAAVDVERDAADVKRPADVERGANVERGADGARFGIDGVSGFMGMRWERPDTVRLTIRPELINAGGLLSGVVTYALVDYCMGSTLWPHTGEQERIATLNISINYIQTAVEGDIVCTTELDRRNRTNAVLRSEVRHEDGRLLVTAIGSYAIFPARKPRPA
ncbi:MAG: PaaI family thioesterase [Solirubrobacteraceae bacterium]